MNNTGTEKGSIMK